MALELHSVKRETVQNSFPKVQFQENLRTFSMGDLSVFRAGLPMEVNNGRTGNGHHIPVIEFIAIVAIVLNVTLSTTLR